MKPSRWSEQELLSLIKKIDKISHSATVDILGTALVLDEAKKLAFHLYLNSKAVAKPCSEAGCQRFDGGELRHHKDCHHYPDSLTFYFESTIEKLSEKISLLDNSALTKKFLSICDEKHKALEELAKVNQEKDRALARIKELEGKIDHAREANLRLIDTMQKQIAELKFEVMKSATPKKS